MSKYMLKLHGCPPFSINKAYYKRSFTRTQKCRDWGTKIAASLSLPDNADAIQRFKKAHFNSKSKAIGIHIIHHIPNDVFYTKAGEISRRSQDLSNVEKMLIDILFDLRHNFNNLGIDDKNIVRLVSEKVASDNYQITIELEILG